MRAEMKNPRLANIAATRAKAIEALAADFAARAAMLREAGETARADGLARVSRMYARDAARQWGVAERAAGRS
jgi:hypothetical protein